MAAIDMTPLVTSRDDVMSNVLHYLSFILTKEALSPLGSSFRSLLISQLSLYVSPMHKHLTEVDMMRVAVESNSSSAAVYEYWSSSIKPQLPDLKNELTMRGHLETLQEQLDYPYDLPDAESNTAAKTRHVSNLATPFTDKNESAVAQSSTLISLHSYESITPIVAVLDGQCLNEGKSDIIEDNESEQFDYTNNDEYGPANSDGHAEEDLCPKIYSSIVPQTTQMDSKRKAHDFDGVEREATDKGGDEEPLKNKAIKRKACDVCKKHFANIGRLRKHLTTHTALDLHMPEDALFPCSICGKVLYERYELKRHEKTHQEAADHPCNKCGKSYKDASALKIHMFSHNDTLPPTAKVFTCSQCEKLFANQSHLSRHMVKHTGSKQFRCDICEKSFSQLSTLKRHVAVMHSEPPPNLKKYCCHICSKLFRNTAELERHINVHTGTKPYVCDVCGVAYTNMKQLNVHKLKHAEKGPPTHICEQCGKSFSNSTYLKVHMRQHTGERPYDCDICHKTFRDHNSLRHHMRRHDSDSTIGKQRCGECGKYVSMGYIRTHMRVHTKEKPFNCQVCSKQFRYKKGLTGHMKLHDKIIEHKCTVCGELFPDQIKLKRHMTSAHTKCSSFIEIQQMVIF